MTMKSDATTPNEICERCEGRGWNKRTHPWTIGRKLAKPAMDRGTVV